MKSEPKVCKSEKRKEGRKIKWQNTREKSIEKIPVKVQPFTTIVFALPIHHALFLHP
jgi:hypothetical protein